MAERERFEWEREHSVLTPEGQIEAAGAMGRGLGKHRTVVGRVFLGLAILFVGIVVVSLVF